MLCVANTVGGRNGCLAAKQAKMHEIYKISIKLETTLAIR